MTDKLFSSLLNEIRDLFSNWDVRGLIDSKKNVYTISQDTKFLSKVFELVIAPVIYNFAYHNNLEVEPARTQIQYPDYSLREKSPGSDQKWIALDIKTSYFRNDNIISGFTLGSFRGSLRDRLSSTYSRFPYIDYSEHWCLCIIYERAESIIESSTFSMSDFEKIPPVFNRIEVHLQPKYKIAWYSPGSGNTANIGSVKRIDEVRKGTGPFSSFNEDLFEDYWRNYLRLEDAQRIGIKQPYNDIESYLRWKNR